MFIASFWSQTCTKAIDSLVCLSKELRDKWRIVFSNKNAKKNTTKICGFLTNKLRVGSYELRVTIYYTSNELLFRYQLRVNIYCTSYELVFTYDLRVTIYWTTDELLFTYKLRVTTNCTSWECSFDSVKFVHYISYTFL